VGARLHAEIDFNNCVHHRQFCRKRLKVLAFDEWRGVSLDPCPHRLRRRFYEVPPPPPHAPPPHAAASR
jgi:hypothetical protein